MRYDTVFFDMDGTVLDTLKDLADAVNHILAEFGYAPVDHNDIAHSLGNGAAHLIRRALAISSGKEPDDALVEAVLSVYKPYYNAHSRVATAPYHGIIELMGRLKAEGVRMAVVSNKPDQTVQELSVLFFGDLLNLSIGESAGIRKKPAPDMVFQAMRTMGLPCREDETERSNRPADQFCGFSEELRRRCVYIGDTEVDLATGANAGMDCIAVDWGFRSREELVRSGARTIVSSTEELFSLL